MARRADGLAAVACALLAAIGATGDAWAEAQARATPLQPYRARYEVHYRGLSGGQIENSLRPAGGVNEWRYETRAFPSLLGRIAVSPQARERGLMVISPEGVRPLSFEFDDGQSGSAKDTRHTFDWANGRVRGEAEGKPFDLAAPPGSQDTASVQAAMLVALLAGRSPQGFPILTGRRLREYRYWPEGRATVMTPLGPFDTVIWASQREGSDRVTKAWHAPALGYVPVQAVQFRKGQAETQMKLVSLER